MSDRDRIVITGVGLTAPNGNSLAEYREAVLAGKSGVQWLDVRYVGKVPAGVCHFNEFKHQTKKSRRRGTRAGSVAIYSTCEALEDAGLDVAALDRDRIGVYLGITEHGNVETEHEVTSLRDFDDNPKYWSHHHNPRTVANNPAGEVTLKLGITGPHVTLGAACAAGNVGLIHGMQQLLLDEVDVALAGGVSESIHTFGIFASFASEGALGRHDDPTKVSRPFDRDRNGIVVSEGGCVYVLERLDAARARGAAIYAEIVGHGMNSDASDFVLPNPSRQQQCMEKALRSAGLQASEIDILSTHATSTPAGDAVECEAVRAVYGDSPRLHINNTKSMIGHAMGAAGALELAGNLPSLFDGMVHPTTNIENLDEKCALAQLVANKPKRVGNITTIQNNSSGMLGINAVVIVKRVEGAPVPKALASST